MTGADGTADLGDLFDRQTTAKIAGGFVVAAVLVYLLGAAVGWDQTIARLRNAELRWLGAACLSTLLCLAAWGKAWQIVLRVGGIDVPYRKLVVTYFAATFANYVTPLGQAGGEPFIAYVLSQDTDANYEQSLASVVTADLLNLLPFFNFAAVGLGYLLLRSQLTETAEDLAVGLGVLAVGIPAIVVAGWQFRSVVERAILCVVEPLARRTDRVTVDSIRERIERFYESIARITGSPRALLSATAFAYVGWVFFALPLYFAGLTLDLAVPLLLVFFVVPASTLAGMVPTPGGLAAVEGALTGLVVALSALSAADALAVATIYRLASYWFAIVVGGAAALWVLYRT
ncbi:lysylphosphatidylglycerol synthase transmembrane domain-containing protein [Halostella pelagica]|uniref:lysylphosphatidylglycerol synthase transmembrane domain-containing protein n=1 Tax=Halostella pelagica TaxID=2583824 RepID=UPI00192A4E77|nr:lysylphosphatidylglycerol synthase transmembrane domain-containing protein [Halostella pelagica]